MRKSKTDPNGDMFTDWQKTSKKLVLSTITWCFGKAKDASFREGESGYLWYTCQHDTLH